MRIQGQKLYWDIPSVSYSYFNVYANGNLTSSGHTFNGTSWERNISGFSTGTKFMVCAMVQTNQVACSDIVTSGGTGGGDPDPDPTTYTVSTVMNGPILLWDVEPKAGAYQVSIKKDAQHKAYMALSGQVDVSPFGYGDYRVDALDIDGNILAQSNTITYSSSGGGDPVDGSVSLQLNGSILSWTIQTEKQVSRTRIYKDGVLIGDTTGSSIDLDDNSVWQLGAGTYKVVPIDTELNVIAESSEVLYDPTGDGGEGGENCGGMSCQQLLDLLACPGWDIYMADITQAIRTAMPPPPDWGYVASVMTSHIIPAMTNALVNTVVPAMGDEIDRRFGQAYYDGNTGATVPTFNDWQPKEQLPEMVDMPNKIDFDLTDESQFPVFEVEDMTETITIADPLGWENPATEDRPMPRFETETRDTVPSGEVEDLAPRETLPSELENEDLHPRPTIPSSEVPDRTDPQPKPTIPDGGAAEPRPTIPSDGESQPTEPSTGNPRDTIPTDWKRGG